MAYSDGEIGRASRSHFSLLLLHTVDVFSDASRCAACPDSHPVRLVTLFMEISFAVQDVEPYRNETMNPSQPFVLAVRHLAPFLDLGLRSQSLADSPTYRAQMGDPLGFGWHACVALNPSPSSLGRSLMHLSCARSDFFNGWPQDLLQKAIEVCTDPGGEIEDCPVLELYNRDLAKVEYPEFCHKTPDYNEVRLLSRPRARRAAAEAAAALVAGRRGEPQVAPWL